MPKLLQVDLINWYHWWIVGAWAGAKVWDAIGGSLIVIVQKPDATPVHIQSLVVVHEQAPEA